MASVPQGRFRVTLVLPRWTVENVLTLLPREGGALEGSLDTLDGHPPTAFTDGRWNKDSFFIRLAVGPGALLLTGRVEGDQLTGTVVIDDTPDHLTGTRI
ncbi:MAG: hypothetical protein IJ751_04865 [Oscillospiraceae bacterium]|nr:hypothetical protein [Oscillospiraceae bacterium]